MKKPHFLMCCLLAIICWTTSILPSRAFTITEDPQYVVMNFSTINELNWATPESEWQHAIKPQVLLQIHQLKQVLPSGSDQRKLAWSTLEEYMNTPLDIPSENSVYAMKLKRILEITEEENLPVFLPFNGFQWWDELPELYNWWDVDGTHTPAVFFNRQKTADFKERFIRGYNPDNKWNVEWQSYTQPMNLNWRNWGSGGFRLAPPPNLEVQYRAPLTYRQVQAGRLKILLKILAQKLEDWQKENKAYLFAGLTIGTEVSLNASATSKDEFQPYGYRGIQDELCSKNQATCGAQLKFTPQQIVTARQEVVAQYLNDLSRTAVNFGIPKQRIYTHVWSEATTGDPRYSNYAAAAWNYYSRPGISLYGYADKPFELRDWEKMITESGLPAWGAVEYSVPKEKTAGVKALTSVLNSSLDSAKVVTLYNWSEHKDTPAIAALQQILNETPTQLTCTLPEVIPLTPNYSDTPSVLEWRYFNTHNSPTNSTKATLHLQKGLMIEPASVQTNVLQTTFNLPLLSAGVPELKTSLPQLPDGVYSWYIELDGCTTPDGVAQQKQFSEPRVMMITHHNI